MNPLGMIFGGVGFFAAMYFCMWMGKDEIKSRRSCTEEKQAKFLGIKPVRYGSGGPVMRGQFEFEYRRKKRQEYTMDHLGGRRGDAFKEGEVYTIYINPQDPSICRCTQKIYYIQDFIFIIVGGIGFYGGAIVVLIEIIKKIVSYL